MGESYGRPAFHVRVDEESVFSGGGDGEALDQCLGRGLVLGANVDRPKMTSQESGVAVGAS